MRKALLLLTERQRRAAARLMVTAYAVSILITLQLLIAEDCSFCRLPVARVALLGIAVPCVGWLRERFDGPGCEQDADMVITGSG